MYKVCPVCNGSRTVKSGVFSRGTFPCSNCLSPDSNGKMVPTGVVVQNRVTCPVCGGGGSFIKDNGMSTVMCSFCRGKGDVPQNRIDAEIARMDEEAGEKQHSSAIEFDLPATYEPPKSKRKGNPKNG